MRRRRRRRQGVRAPLSGPACAPRDSRARSSGRRTWEGVPAGVRVLHRDPGANGRRAPWAERGAGSLPLRPCAMAPGCGQTWSYLARAPAPPFAPRSISAAPVWMSQPALTLIQTRTLPVRIARDPQSYAYAFAPVPHTPHPPRAAWVPAPLRTRGSTYLSRQPRCGVRSSGGLGSCGRPKQQQ